MTDRKRAQEALRANEAELHLITDTLPMRIAYVDKEQRNQFVNRLVEEHEGRPAAEIIGKTLREVLGDDRYDRVRAYVEDALAGRSFVQTWRGPFAGKTADLRATFVADVSEAGDVLGTIMLLEDVSEAKALSEQLRQAQKMETIGQLTGGIAHDFNNLLTVILGNLELLDSQLDDAQLGKRIEIASRAVSRGADLTDKLLSFARRRALHPEHADLNVTLAPHGDLLQRTLGEAIEVELKLAREPCFTRVDIGELQTTLLNLVINARDAMPRGGRLVVLTERVALNGDIQVFSAEAPRGDFIKVEVSDTGMGMNSNVMERLFEPFFTTKEVGKGTVLGLGLGLSLSLSQVYGFVSQSEGYISVDSKESFGTRVAIYLPTAEPEAKPVSERDVKPETARGGHEKILVVEDNNEVRDVAVGMLRELGYEVVPATDGNDALKLLDQHDDIELLFTDVMMPGGYSGPALAAKARETRLQLKVLYCSGYSEAVFAEHEVDEQEVDIIAKPGDVRDYVSGGKGVLPVVMQEPRTGAPRCHSELRRLRVYRWPLRS